MGDRLTAGLKILGSRYLRSSNPVPPVLPVMGQTHRGNHTSLQ